MRARFHVRGGRLGFFREGTHDLCDVRVDAPAPARDVRRAGSADGGASIERRRGRAGHRAVGERRRVRARRPSRDRTRRRRARGRAPDGDRRLHGGAARHRSPAIRRRHRDRSSGVTCWRSFRATGFCCADLVAHVAGQLPANGRRRGSLRGRGAVRAGGGGARRACRRRRRRPLRRGRPRRRTRGPAAGRSSPCIRPSRRGPATARSGGDAMVVDPPRTGLSREALGGLTRLRAAARRLRLVRRRHTRARHAPARRRRLRQRPRRRVRSVPEHAARRNRRHLRAVKVRLKPDTT